MTHLTQFPYQNWKLKIFSPPTDKITVELLKQYQNLDPVIRQLKSWHKYKTKPVKADMILIALTSHIHKICIHSLRIRENILKIYTKFLFPKCTNLDKSIMQ